MSMKHTCRRGNTWHVFIRSDPCKLIAYRNIPYHCNLAIKIENRFTRPCTCYPWKYPSVFPINTIFILSLLLVNQLILQPLKVVLSILRSHLKVLWRPMTVNLPLSRIGSAYTPHHSMGRNLPFNITLSKILRLNSLYTMLH